MVAEGPESTRHSKSGPVRLTAIRAPRAAAPLTLFQNVELPAPGRNDTASNVGEPSVALNKDTILYTGNWYAAVSVNGGTTFKYIDPATAFRRFDPPGSTFCCDQVAHYIPQIDTFVWLLQYGPDTGDNFQRLAFAKTADVGKGKWQLFDITTQSLGVPGAFLDFPDLAVGANSLYVTTNVFQGRQAGAAIVRISLASIQGGKPKSQRMVDMANFSYRVAQNCGTTAYFGCHEDTSHIRVFTWKESESKPKSVVLPVARYIAGNGYRSTTPDKRRWLDRADPRMTGATLNGKDLYFAWGVDRRSNQRTQPFAQIAKVNTGSMSVTDNINVFDPDSAICYPALSTNKRGEIGITYMLGGGPRFPSHVIGVLDDDQQDIVVAESDRGPLPDPKTHMGEWGDFLTIRRCYPDQSRFIATGYTMKGKGDGSNQDATPRLVIFGR